MHFASSTARSLFLSYKLSIFPELRHRSHQLAHLLNYLNAVNRGPSNAGSRHSATQMSFQCRSSCRRKNCLSTGRHVRHRRLFSQHLSRIQYCGKLLNLYAAQNFIFSIHSASVFIPFIQSITVNQENTNIAEKETVSIIYTSCHESFILC